MNRQPIETMTTTQIAILLEQDGYDALAGRAADIKRAAAKGALLWTKRRLTATLPSIGIEIDARPER